jgi:tetratricopeptide (TPR) repeat protein
MSQMRLFISILFSLLIPGISFGQTFYEHYAQGLENLKNDSLNQAVEHFEHAIKLSGTDRKQARTYGVNFVEYFPNRELGIAYYKKNDLDKAIQYLEKSMEQQPSDRAEEYLLTIGQVRHDRSLSVVDDDPPEIKIYSPAMLNTKVFQPVPNPVKQITLVGNVKDAGGIYEVIVNDKTAPVSGSGDFSAEVLLGVGQNELFVKATDMKQNSITRSYLIYREDTVISGIEALMDQGKYYALIIGISEYSDPSMTDLDGFPVQDAERLAKILTERYSFDQENIMLLKDADRLQIMRAFDKLSATLTRNDNLLIFYAGHGYYDEETELGYWLPSDAEKEFTANWIYNDVLVANLRRIRSKHTLLISDACFSGSIFKTRSLMQDAPTAYQKKYELSSRKAITSGVLKTVPNKSVFFKYLADRLENNTDKYLSASQLFQEIEIPVANNSPNTPQYGVIQGVGDEGGDFIFILEQANP